jgi:hypothetical protein
MMKSPPYPTPHGPFRADQLRSGDPYELSAGHTVPCLPTGGRGSRTNLLGAQVLETDPAVESAGVDTGFTPAPDVLRAPDVAVGNVADAPGWVPGAPPLALEYADGGQDEAELTSKVRDLLSWGTRCVWVVRLAIHLTRDKLVPPWRNITSFFALNIRRLGLFQCHSGYAYFITSPRGTVRLPIPQSSGNA